MKVTIDSAGRIVIPKNIRERAHLRAGSSLELSFHDGSIVLEPLPLEVEVAVHEGIWVARPLTAVDPLDPLVVEQTLNAVRGRE